MATKRRLKYCLHTLQLPLTLAREQVNSPPETKMKQAVDSNYKQKERSLLDVDWS